VVSSPGGSEGGDEGEKTYEDTIKEICEGHDLIFYTTSITIVYYMIIPH